MKDKGFPKNGIVTVLLITILVLLAWFFFLKPDPCFTARKLSDQRQGTAVYTYEFNRPAPPAASDAEIKARFACARSLK